MTKILRIGEQFVSLELLTKEQLKVALEIQAKTKQRLGEVLMGLRFVSETDILKVLAERFQVSYLGSFALARIDIPLDVTEIFDEEFARRRFVLPLRFDAQTSTLYMLANTPTDKKLKKEAQLLAGCENVVSFLGMQETIRAGINRYYKNDLNAFHKVGDAAMGQRTLLMHSDWARLDASRHFVFTHHAGKSVTSEIIKSASIHSDNYFIETLHVVISVMEMNRGRFRSHSARVAKLTKQIAEALKLPPVETYYAILAAYLHDFGKREGLHHTLLNIQSALDKTLAQKFLFTPLQLLSSARFPSKVGDIIMHIFERNDGMGFPDGLAGHAIPVGSRIIALVDAFVDEMSKPENESCSLEEMAERFKAYAGELFDEEIIEALFSAVYEESDDSVSLARDLDQFNALLIDPNEHAYAPLTEFLKDAGLAIRTIKNTDQAIDILLEQETDIILIDMHAAPLNGVQFTRTVRANPDMAKIPLIALSASEESEHAVKKIYDAGGDDCFTKPLKVDAILTRVSALLEEGEKANALDQSTEEHERRRSVAVTGSLSEIALPDMVQLLTNSRKQGKLTLRKGKEEASVFVADGFVTNCFYGEKKGEKAFYALLHWDEGEFSFESASEMPEHVIQLPPENLMLEGLRLLDESNAGM